MNESNGAPRKPKALAAGSRLGVFAPASPAESVEMIAGLAELKRHGFQVVSNQDTKAEGYFAGPSLERVNGFLGTLNSNHVDGLVALRGGYGSNYLLEFELEKSLASLKCMIGFSDLTTLQIFLWQKCKWITFYGPMVAAGLNAGSGVRKGYDENSFLQAVGRTFPDRSIPGKSSGWLHDPSGSHHRNAMGIGHQGFDPDSRRPRDAALSGGSRLDAFEASRKI